MQEVTFYNLEVKDLIDKWMEYLKLEMSSSKNTISSYYSDIKHFFEFCSIHNQEIITIAFIKNIKPTDLRSWLSFNKNNKLKNSSNARFTSSLKNFFTFLRLKYGIENDKIMAISRPKIEQKLPKIMEEYDVDKIINKEFCIDTLKQSWHWSQFLAIFSLLYGCGLRISEALSIKLKDYRISVHFINILGKGSQYRSVPLTPNIKEMIDNHLDLCPFTRSIDFNADIAIFYSKTGRIMSRENFYHQLREFSQMGIVEHGITPHSFRHSCACHLINLGASSREIQELLGHRSLSSTQIYAKFDRDKVRQLYENCNPRENPIED